MLSFAGVTVPPRRGIHSHRGVIAVLPQAPLDRAARDIAGNRRHLHDGSYNTPVESLTIVDALPGGIAHYQRLFSRLRTVTLCAAFACLPVAVQAVPYMENSRELTVNGPPIDGLLDAVAVYCPHLEVLDYSGIEVLSCCFVRHSAE